MKSALLGALLVVGGIAAQITAARHVPQGGCGWGTSCGAGQPSFPSGWSATAYDIVRIAGWALVVSGGVIVAFALMREFRRPA